MIRRLILTATLFLCYQLHSNAVSYPIYNANKWTDSVFQSMTIEEKIGQLFMISAYTAKDKSNQAEVVRLIKKYKVGGVIFFKGGPVRTALAVNQFQNASKIPLMMSIDGEWGLSMRLDSTLNYGFHMPLGASQSDSLTYLVGRRIAQECKRIGIQINFGPVADVNNNPMNPVINTRSFGENKLEVARKSILYMQGLQDEHVLAVAKHFPGHGNTDVDSHFDLPVLKQSKQSLDTLELYPFKKLFNAGVGAVMLAHLNIPSLDSTPHLATSMSPNVGTQLLRKQLNFFGLSFTDALNMKGATKYNDPGESEYKAFLAGNDVLLCPEYVGKGMALIKAAIDSGCISIDFLNQKVKRILEAKYWMGLNNCRLVDTNHLIRDLNIPAAQLLKMTINNQAVTLVKNKDNFLPLKSPENVKIASLSIGSKGISAFQELMRKYWPMKDFQINMYAKDWEYKLLQDSLDKYDVIIVGLHYLNSRSSTYGIADKAYELLSNYSKEKKLILVNFSTPYALSRFPNFDYVVNAYQDETGFQESAAQVIFGGITSKGKLPVNVSAQMKMGSGLGSGMPIRVQYAIPEEAGMSTYQLSKIDTIIKKGIEAKAMPGCQVFISKDGKVIYEKSFGHKVYDGQEKVNDDDLYDIASITKVASTTLVAMKLYENGQLSLDKTLGDYLPELKNTNKSNLTIKEVMSHQAGLQSFIPFYKKLINPKTGLCNDYFCYTDNSTYGVKVADNMYMDLRYLDTMNKQIDESKLEYRGRYKYSDLGFIYIKRVVESITHKTLNKLADSLFYNPLGLQDIGYLPIKNHLSDKIIPTENDNYFRRQLLQGYVHDPTAAMMGGVSGHAGLFASANDLGVLFQMLLNQGQYGGKTFFKPETIQLFTCPQFIGNKRGLGWDKPEPDINKNGPTSSMCSPQTFGHTGFTGTCVWADPTTKLVYVFLSNRVYPSAENNKLVDMNIRTKIQDVIYNSLLKRNEKPIINSQLKN